MAEVHPDPSAFGQPEVAPVAAPAPEPAPSILEQVEAHVEAVAHEVEQLVHPEPQAPTGPPAATAVEETEDSSPQPRVETGWHILSGLGNGVTLPPSMR